jgi:hypothetical protein
MTDHRSCCTSAFTSNPRVVDRVLTFYMAVLIAVGPAEGIMFSVKKNVGRIHVIRKKYLLAVPCGFVQHTDGFLCD